ncbi:hypothetical protein PG985_009918 [Apiospora marii]|uniref:uncharacterized protein n=1 Tax=Apiospora marii TaxID=335849 RepID=UPI00312DEA5F
MPSLSNLSALAGFLSLAAVAVDAKPINNYSVTALPHHSSAVNATSSSYPNTKNATSISSSHHYYDTAGKNVTGSSGSGSGSTYSTFSNSTSIIKNGTHHEGAINWGALRCPEDMDDESGILPTPTYGTEGRAWMVCSETLIQAPPRRVYDALVDFGRYRDWNSYVTDVEIVHPTTSRNATTAKDHGGKVYEGMELTFTFNGLGGEGVVTTGPEVVTVLSGGGRGNWETPATSGKKTGGAQLMNAYRSDLSVADELIRSEHPNVITVADEGYARLVSWETYYEGKSTETFKLLRAQMQALNDQQGADLKAYLEKK